MGPPRSRKKRPKRYQHAWACQRNFFDVAASLCRGASPGQHGDGVRWLHYRIRPLVTSALPRVRARTTAAIIMITRIAIPMLRGVNKPPPDGVGLGVAVAGGAFFAASMLRAYCSRCTVS